MTHPQNSPRGLFAKQQVEIAGQTLYGPASTYIQFSAGIALSGQTDIITQAAGGLKLPTGLALSGKTSYFTANSTATLIIPTVAAKPSARQIGGLCFVSTGGKQMLAYHSTGGTWKYIAATSVLA